MKGKRWIVEKVMMKEKKKKENMKTGRVEACGEDAIIWP